MSLFERFRRLFFVRRLKPWRTWEPVERNMAYAMILVVAAIGVLLVYGCQSPRRIAAYAPTPRLMEARDFQTCMTGPHSTVWIRLGAAVWRGEPCGQFDVLVLPDSCEVYDRDGDGDVDLADFQEMQNGE